VDRVRVVILCHLGVGRGGILPLFAWTDLLCHYTSASLTINENADPTVRTDFENHFQRSVPENEPYYQHLDEGSDDLPAHIKSSLLGCSLNIPISNGRLNLGVWQGIYLGEHRNHGGRRTLVVTLQGSTSPSPE